MQRSRIVVSGASIALKCHTQPYMEWWHAQHDTSGSTRLAHGMGRSGIIVRREGRQRAQRIRMRSRWPSLSFLRLTLARCTSEPSTTTTRAAAQRAANSHAHHTKKLTSSHHIIIIYNLHKCTTASSGDEQDGRSPEQSDSRIVAETQAAAHPLDRAVGDSSHSEERPLHAGGLTGGGVM